jgi:chromosomal replication initiator protein
MAQISIETWEEILQNVKEKSDIPDISFRTWIQPLKVQEVRGNTIAVLVTTGVMGVEYISKKYLRLLKTAALEVTGIGYGIEFILPEKMEVSH